uniref:Putative lipocalin n=1 Tax=Ixodes ricinus TaxID=34613 RepID=A0A6B0UZ99_IXORI
MRAWMFFVLALLGNAIEKRNWLNATFAAMQQVEQYLKTTDSIYYVYQGTKATDPMKRDGEERSGDTFRCPYMRIRVEETTPHGYKSRWVTRVFSTGFSVRQWQLSLVLEKSGNYSTYNFFSVNERDLLKKFLLDMFLVYGDGTCALFYHWLSSSTCLFVSGTYKNITPTRMS